MHLVHSNLPSNYKNNAQLAQALSTTKIDAYLHYDVNGWELSSFKLLEQHTSHRSKRES